MLLSGGRTTSLRSSSLRSPWACCWPAAVLAAGLGAVGSLHPCPQENLLSHVTNSRRMTVLVRVAMTKTVDWVASTFHSSGGCNSEIRAPTGSGSDEDCPPDG